MNVTHHFSLPNKKDADEAKSLGPNVTGLSLDQTIDAILLWFNRALWTGVNDPALTGNDETVGLHVLRWMKANAALNHGMGPAISCGTMAHACIGLLAAYGVYARLLVAVDGKGRPDHTVEIFSNGKWWHAIPQLNGWFISPYYGNRLSYREWSQFALKGMNVAFTFYSPTEGWPTLPSLDYFKDEWVRGQFVRAACTVNGNRAYVNGDGGDFKILQIIRDPSNLNPDWNKGIDVSPQDLYPIPG